MYAGIAWYPRTALADLAAGMHINDSKCELGSRRDRHENIGQGLIGLGLFECIMNDSRLDGDSSGFCGVFCLCAWTSRSRIGPANMSY